jgi:uncharacterized protein (TIGR00369 family)
VPTDPDFRARVEASFARQGLMGSLGARLTRVEPGECEIRLPYSPALSQQDGFFHAGAIGSIADSAGGYAAFTLMDASDRVLTVEYKLNLLAPARGELAIARGQVVRAGRTLTVARIDVFAVASGVETLCAAAQQTLIRRPG